MSSQPSRIYSYPLADGLFVQEEYQESRRHFTHPGVFATDQAFATIREHVQAGHDPWVKSLAHWEAWAQDALTRDPDPVQRIFRRTPNHIGVDESIRDFQAAQQLAWLYRLTDRTDYADKAIEIIDAWSGTLKAVRGAGFNLQSGLMIPSLIDAAEILKNAGDRWSQAGQARFRGFCETVLLPHVLNLRISINGNHDCATNIALTALGVYLDDEFLFNRALNYYLHSKGYGSIAHYFLPNGECQEDGRDMGHVRIGIHFFARIAAIAYNQGENLYDRFDYRLAAAMEHYARVQMDYYTPAMYSSAHLSPSRQGRSGRGVADLSELKAYQYFTRERNLPMPFITRLLRTAQAHLEGCDGDGLAEHHQVFLADELTVPPVPSLPPAGKDGFRFGVIPFDGGPMDDANYALLSSALEQAASSPVEIVYAQDMETLLQGVHGGILDAALVPPCEYVTHQDALDLAVVASERMPDGRAGFHHLWLAPKAAGVKTLTEAFNADVILAGVFPFALPSCIDLLPLVDAGLALPDILAHVRFDQGNGNYAYKVTDMFQTLFAAGQPDNTFAAVATTDIEVNACKLPLSKLGRSAHTFPFVEKYFNDWQKILPYYTPFFAEALTFGAGSRAPRPRHYLDCEDQVVTLWTSPEIPGQAVVMRKGSEIDLTCPPNYLSRDEWHSRLCFPGLTGTDDSRYDIIRRAMALKRDLFENHAQTPMRVGGGVKVGKATEKGMPETVFHDLRFGGNLRTPADSWDFAPEGWLRRMLRV